VSGTETDKISLFQQKYLGLVGFERSSTKVWFFMMHIEKTWLRSRQNWHAWETERGICEA
jgi:hypothetical protein